MKPLLQLEKIALKRLRDLELRLAEKRGELNAVLECKKMISETQRIENLKATNKRLREMPRFSPEDLPANFGKLVP